MSGMSTVHYLISKIWLKVQKFYVSTFADGTKLGDYLGLLEDAEGLWGER